MPKIKRINIGYFKSRVKGRKKAPRGRVLKEVRVVAEKHDNILELELETLYMIGAPAS